MMTGYSQTPLSKKLGIKPHSRIAAVGAPEAFYQTLEPLPEEVSMDNDLSGTHDLDVIVFFCRTQAELDSRLKELAVTLAPAGGLWVAWPKKSSRVATDLEFASVQAAGLQLGLVDNKVCSIDEVFSGLRFVVRRENRDAWAAGSRV
jgi:hypothetical protein